MAADPSLSDRVPLRPSLTWRVSSMFTLGLVASLSRLYMFAFEKTDLHGLNDFLKLLDERKRPEDRRRGLITGMPQELLCLGHSTDWSSIKPPHRVRTGRHLEMLKCRADTLAYSVDDPLMWGSLPLRYSIDADNMRWGLGSYHLCFRNK
jgi:monolysocardiolipin acyltransferase